MAPINGDGALAPGISVTGEYLGGVQEPDRTDKNDASKVYAGRFKVKLLVGDRVLQVEYRDRAAAEAAVGADLEEVERGTMLHLPIGVRAAKGFAFFYGRQG